MSKYERNSAQRTRLAAALLAAVSMAAALPSQGYAAAYSFKKIAMQGEKALGGQGAFEYELKPASLDAKGSVMFRATLTSGNRGLFQYKDGRNTFVAEAKGTPALQKASGPAEILAKLQPGMMLANSDAIRATPSLVTNSKGQAAFAADVTPMTSVGKQAGVYLWSEGTARAIARPGDAMPGGGILLTASLLDGNVDLNEAGDVAFTATLRNDEAGALDTGLYLYSAGKLSLVARRGTEVANLGRIERIQASLVSEWNASGGAALNEAGQIAFAAVLEDHNVVLLVATPGKGGDDAIDAVPSTLAIKSGTMFRQDAAVRFALPRTGDMSLRLYAVDGRRVATLAQGTMPAGRHEAMLNAKGIAPGVYFLRLQAGSETVNQKVTLVH